MKRACDRDLSASRRSMVCAMPASVAYPGAEQLNDALRFNFFGYWFMRKPIRERCEI